MLLKVSDRIQTNTFNFTLFSSSYLASLSVGSHQHLRNPTWLLSHLISFHTLFHVAILMLDTLCSWSVSFAVRENEEYSQFSVFSFNFAAEWIIEANVIFIRVSPLARGMRCVTSEGKIQDTSIALDTGYIKNVPWLFSVKLHDELLLADYTECTCWVVEWRCFLYICF